MIVRWSDEVQVGSNLKSILSLTLVDVKLIDTYLTSVNLVSDIFISNDFMLNINLLIFFKKLHKMLEQFVMSPLLFFLHFFSSLDLVL